MRHSLIRHPHSQGGAAVRVEAEAIRPRAAVLVLNYFVIGTIDGLNIPTEGPPVRADELWQRTCFEAFLSGVDSGYYEFNFAPTLAWAAYRFGGYRSGMRVADEIPQPRFVASHEAGTYAMQVSLDLSGTRGLTGKEIWHLGLSAVIAEKGGLRSYWALAHPADTPDFHHPHGFVAELPPGQSGVRMKSHEVWN